jgi:hypothetical protein
VLLKLPLEVNIPTGKRKRPDEPANGASPTAPRTPEQDFIDLTTPPAPKRRLFDEKPLFSERCAEFVWKKPDSKASKPPVEITIEEGGDVCIRLDVGECLTIDARGRERKVRVICKGVHATNTLDF